VIQSTGQDFSAQASRYGSRESSKETTWQLKTFQARGATDFVIFAASFRNGKAPPKLSPIRAPPFLFWVPDLRDGLGPVSPVNSPPASASFIGPRTNITSHGCPVVFVVRYHCPAGVAFSDFGGEKSLKDAKGNIVVFSTNLFMLCTALRFTHCSASSMESDHPFIPSCALHAFSDSSPCYLLNRLVPSILTL
jgi:hypothetical protein